MLPEQLPTCIFGHKNWRPGGAQLGPGYDQEWFSCHDCGLTALYLSEDGGNLFLILQQLDGDQLTKEISTWLNDTLRVFWRANAAELKKDVEVAVTEAMRSNGQRQLPVRTIMSPTERDSMMSPTNRRVAVPRTLGVDVGTGVWVTASGRCE